jgi:SAM-dependent methyltransferase
VAEPAAAADFLDAEALHYYRLTESWNEKFWARMDGPVPVVGSRSLDLGCGVGALTTDLVRRGSIHAVGIDPDGERIRIARLAATLFQPHLVDRVEYRAERIQDLDGDARFDVVVSRDTFEHIHDLPVVLREIARVLRPGGRCYVGFGPLYRSPFGDHGLLGIRIPWAHLILAPMPNAPRFRARLGKRRVEELARELNGLALIEIEGMVELSPLRFESLRVNVSHHPGMRVLARARSIPRVREFATVNVYAVLVHA